jgi:hypothetical protein
VICTELHDLLIVGMVCCTCLGGLLISMAYLRSMWLDFMDILALQERRKRYFM